MTLRAPPRLAACLLKHFGPSYRSESLAGDLFEEYQLNRSPVWYWRQVVAAICVGRAMNLRKIFTVPRLAVPAMLRFSIEAAALIGCIALAEQFRRTCPIGPAADIAWVVTIVAAAALCFSVGSYVSFCISLALRRRAVGDRSAPIKPLIRVFAITALSAGTLTWANTAPRAPQQCAQPGAPFLPSAAQGPANEH
jgi:hypothetical protein